MPAPALPPPVPVFRRWWHWINALSLDAVAVAMTWLMVFAKMTGARLTMVNFGALAAAVWLVYMTDRLADGWTRSGTQGRHLFARKQTPWLLPLMVAVAGGTGWWVLHQMRWVTVQAGVALAAAVMLYFIILAASRWKAVSPALLLMMSTILIMGLIQGEEHGTAGIQLWRAVAAGTLLTVLYFGLRYHYTPPPWTLIKKVMGGYLFALGVALGPYSHLQDWETLLRGAPVVLFAGACALNSLGIRLWENRDSTDPEMLLLGRLYPWLLAAVGLGAAAQAWEADPWTRPVLVGIAVCAGGFGLLHLMRQRGPVSLYSLLADGLMVAVGWGVICLE